VNTKTIKAYNITYLMNLPAAALLDLLAANRKHREALSSPFA